MGMKMELRVGQYLSSQWGSFCRGTAATVLYNHHHQLRLSITLLKHVQQ